MDFASLMSKAITDARSTNIPSGSNKVYIKRAEIESERQKQYAAEQREIEAKRKAKLLEKRKREEEEAKLVQRRKEKQRKLAEESRQQKIEREAAEERNRRKRLGLPDLVQEDKQKIEENDISDEELFQKLRQMGEPIKLFGESHKQRLRRFHKLGTVMTSSIIPTTLELVEEKDMKVDKVPKDKEERNFLFRQLASYFTMVMTEWESALNKEKRDTFASKAAHNAMHQSRESMVPVSKFKSFYLLNVKFESFSSFVSLKKEISMIVF